MQTENKASLLQTGAQQGQKTVL